MDFMGVAYPKLIFVSAGDIFYDISGDESINGGELRVKSS
jgi:hypothetical protein